MKTKSVVLVHPSRLEYGEWKGNKQVGQGDINKSCSCGDDGISAGKVRQPFIWEGNLMVATGGMFYKERREYEAYRLVPINHFDGEPTTYMKKGEPDCFESARNDPLGFYHGMTVKWRGEEYVLVGPEIKFVGDAKQPGPVKQLELL